MKISSFVAIIPLFLIIVFFFLYYYISVLIIVYANFYPLNGVQ